MNLLIALSALLAVVSAGSDLNDTSKPIRYVNKNTLKGFVKLTTLRNSENTGYLVNVGIGSPPQNFTLAVDLSSSDTWVRLKGNDSCHDGQRGSSAWPSCPMLFDPNVSSTLKDFDSNGFDAQYVDKSFATGDYFKDTITVDGNITIVKQRVGLVTKSAAKFAGVSGVLGLGLHGDGLSRSKYPSFLDNLVGQGFIDTPIFSLYPESISGKRHSTFLFGGADVKKYNNTLVKIPHRRINSVYTRRPAVYALTMNRFSVSRVKLPNRKSKAIIDPGTPLVLLPSRVVQPLVQKFRAVPVPGTGMMLYYVDCLVANSPGNRRRKFHFRFPGLKISVPVRDMVIQVTSPTPRLGTDAATSGWGTPEANRMMTKNEGTCILAIGDIELVNPELAGAKDIVVLGESFLRSAYVVFDLARDSVSMAQALPEAETSEIIRLNRTDLTTLKLIDMKKYREEPASAQFPMEDCHGCRFDDRDDLDKISKGWSIAMVYSRERLRRVHDLDDAQLARAVEEGKLVLETLCLFVHACIKRGQYRLPSEFWRVLHVEYGIVVFPSALTADIETQGLGVEVTFTDAYARHIFMCGHACTTPPPCPFEYLQEAPPVYQKEVS